MTSAAATVLAAIATTAGLFATARLTRLLAADRILQPLRAAVVRRYGPSSALGYFVHCRWCVSLWMSIPVAAAVVWIWDELTGDYTWPVRVVFAALLALFYSHGTALLAGLEDED